MSKGGSQSRAGVTGVADLFTAARIPLAFAFPLVPGPEWQAVVLATAAVTDFIDGWLARRRGSSRLGPFLDPVADKLFMASAFGVVLFSGRLSVLEVVAVMLRDLVTTAAFVGTIIQGKAASVPARLSGKVVTVAQLITLVAFLADLSVLRPLAWITGALAVVAVWDYGRLPQAERRMLSGPDASTTGTRDEQ